MPIILNPHTVDRDIVWKPGQNVYIISTIYHSCQNRAQQRQKIFWRRTQQSTQRLF